MNKVFCPFCHQEVTEDAEPTVVSNALGITYTYYKKICRNKAQHNNNGNIAIPYKTTSKKENSKQVFFKKAI